MHHAASENFKPAGILAHLTTHAAAYETFHVHLGRRFSEWKVRCAEAQPRPLTEHTAHKVCNRPFQVGEGDILANRETFHLIKLNFRTRTDLLITEAHAGQCDTNGWWVFRIHRSIFPHRTDL